jgi:hypothetical protein
MRHNSASKLEEADHVRLDRKRFKVNHPQQELPAQNPELHRQLTV